jgi:hypothetical protein
MAQHLDIGFDFFIQLAMPMPQQQLAGDLGDLSVKLSTARVAAIQGSP